MFFRKVVLLYCNLTVKFSIFHTIMCILTGFHFIFPLFYCRFVRFVYFILDFFRYFNTTFFMYTLVRFHLMNTCH